MPSFWTVEDVVVHIVEYAESPVDTMNLLAVRLVQFRRHAAY
jgi:hypothetical protein